MGNRLISASDYVQNLLKSLDILWKGLVAVLVVISLIVAVTYAIRFTAERASALRSARSGAGGPDEKPESPEEK